MLHPRDVLFIHQMERRQLQKKAELERLTRDLPRSRLQTAIVQLGCRLPVLRSAPECALSSAS